MNITFLVILFLWVVVLYLLKNLFNINTKGKKKRAWMLLAILTLIITELLLLELGAIDKLIHFYLLSFPFKFLIGPLIWMQSENKKRVSKSWLHFIPMVIGFSLLTPTYSLDKSQKLLLLENPSLVIQLLSWFLVGQLLFYLFKFMQAGNQNEKQLGHNLILTMGLVLYFLSIAHAAYSFPTSNKLPELLGTFAMLVFVIVHQVRQFALSGRESIDKNLIGLLNDVMAKEKLFLQKNLNLQELANHIDSSPGKVSKAINAGYGGNFNEYVNHFRVEESIRLLKEEENKKYTLEAISEMAGFSSSTTFNQAFKKETGKTPSDYKF